MSSQTSHPLALVGFYRNHRLGFFKLLPVAVPVNTNSKVETDVVTVQMVHLKGSLLGELSSHLYTAKLMWTHDSSKSGVPETFGWVLWKDFFLFLGLFFGRSCAVILGFVVKECSHASFQTDSQSF